MHARPPDPGLERIPSARASHLSAGTSTHSCRSASTARRPPATDGPSDGGAQLNGPPRGIRTGGNQAGFGPGESEHERRHVREGGGGETRTGSISEALPSGGPRFRRCRAVEVDSGDGETRTRTSSEALPSGGPRFRRCRAVEVDSGDGETRTRTISEALPSGGPRYGSGGATVGGETRTRTSSEALPSGGPRFGAGGAGVGGETRTRTSSEALPSGGPRFGAGGAGVGGETRTRTSS